MNRTQKISGLDLALHLMNVDPAALAARNQDMFKIKTEYTSLRGPNITLETPQYSGNVTVDFAGNVVRFETYGYVHRFADQNAFLVFFEKTLESPLHACHKLAGEIGGKTMGNSIILSRDNVAYYLVEARGGFDVSFNNEKMFMSYDDVVALLGA